MGSQTVTLKYGFWDLIANSGPVGKGIMLLLLLSSIWSWGIIFSKWRLLKRASHQNTGFLDVFWHSKSIDEIFAKSDQFGASPVATVFKSGFKELKKLSGGDTKPIEESGVDNVNRALFRSSATEIAALEKNLSWLATTASAAPFVGLFGTVWGIIDAFQRIGATGSANLAVVAPGISEALVATAAGIGAAIPAVVAYNHFLNHVKRISIEMDGFNHDFLNIVQRTAISVRKGG